MPATAGNISRQIQRGRAALPAAQESVCRMMDLLTAEQEEDDFDAR